MSEVDWKILNARRSTKMERLAKPIEELKTCQLPDQMSEFCFLPTVKKKRRSENERKIQ